MKTTGEIRRANLELLIKEFGTLEALAGAVGSSSVYLSQVRRSAVDARTNRPREIGSAMARRLEEACDPPKPPGWMDVEHTETEKPKFGFGLPCGPVKSGPEKVAELLAEQALAKSRKSSRGVEWPFPKIDQGKLLGLRGEPAIELQAAIIVAAAHLGIDIESLNSKPQLPNAA